MDTFGEFGHWKKNCWRVLSILIQIDGTTSVDFSSKNSTVTNLYDFNFSTTTIKLAEGNESIKQSILYFICTFNLKWYIKYT